MEPYVIVPILAFLSVTLLGGVIIFFFAQRRRTLQARMSDEQGTSHESHGDSIWLSFITRLGAMGSSKGTSKSLQLELQRAGLHSPLAVPVYLGTKLLLLIVGLTLSAPAVFTWEMALYNKILIVMIVSFTAFFIPNFFVQIRSSMRASEVRSHLPDMIDLLEICVSGGTGLDMAWNAAADEVRAVSPMLADEMALTSLAIHLGDDRGSAIHQMAERTGSKELAGLVSVLVQSEKFGTSIGEALRVFASSMREERSAKAEESAEKMAVKMLILMTIFIFPVVLIVAVGPAAIKLVENLSGG